MFAVEWKNHRTKPVNTLEEAQHLARMFGLPPARIVQAHWEPIENDAERMARAWHAASDHHADGTPYGAPTCNCEHIAQRALTLGWTDKGHGDGTP